MEQEVARLLDTLPGMRWVEVLLPDMNGILRGKRIGRNDLDKLFGAGMPLPGATTMMDTKGLTFEALGFGGDDGDPDVLCHAVRSSLAPVPWLQAPTGQVLITMSEVGGAPYFADPRRVLERAIEPLTDAGLRPVVATELEFYLLEEDPAGAPALKSSRIPGSQLEQDGPHFGSLDDLNDMEAFFAEVDESCEAQNLPASTAVAEFAPSQFEINLQHVPDPVLACDHAVLLKRLVKNVARRHGAVASFMAKPFAEHSGCGLHIHVSLLDEQGRNVFAPAEKQGDGLPFSKSLRHAVGGLAEAMPESMAVFAPNANSYRRFRPGMFVALAPTWGINHRNLSMRVPLSDAANARIEHRVAGADANPYLVMAAVLAGIHHGIEKRCEPGPMIAQGATTPKDLTLPVRWEASLDAFERGQILPRYLGEEYCRIFGICRRGECDRFHSEVSDRDYEWYLRYI